MGIRITQSLDPQRQGLDKSSGLHVEGEYEPANGTHVQIQSADRGVQMPAVGDSFEFVLTRVAESEPGAGDEILHCL